MQIHELNTFVGTPSATDYLAIDDGTETNKVPATALGVSTQMAQDGINGHNNQLRFRGKHRIFADLYHSQRKG